MKTSRNLVLPVLLLTISPLIWAQIPPDLTVKPEAGFVPNEKTAIAIAKAVWEPIYGEKCIRKEAPFHATLTNGVWYVNETLPSGYKGGTAYAEIAKTDGRIIRIIHGK